MVVEFHAVNEAVHDRDLPMTGSWFTITLLYKNREFMGMGRRRLYVFYKN